MKVAALLTLLHPLRKAKAENDETYMSVKDLLVVMRSGKSVNPYNN